MDGLSESQVKALAETLFDTVDNMFNTLSQGLDVAPAAQYRLEGQLQLLLSLNVFTWDEYVARCEAGMQQCGLDVPSEAYWQWCFNEGEVYLRLPLVMVEAPVYK